MQELGNTQFLECSRNHVHLCHGVTITGKKRIVSTQPIWAKYEQWRINLQIMWCQTVINP